MSSNILEARGVTKRFAGLVANDDVSFAVAEGELVSIIGPNGAGKSTLFGCITGFHRPNAGTVVWRGRDITGFKADLAWRRLPYSAREDGREAFARVVEEARQAEEFEKELLAEPAAEDTPLDETLGALDQAVRSGKAIYAGISSYSGAMTADTVRLTQQNGYAKPVIHQPSYSMLNRWVEPDLLPITQKFGLGVIAFCPLAQGLLTNKYLAGIPQDSRAAAGGFLKPSQITEALQQKLKKLNDVAAKRGQSLAQMSLSWVLRTNAVTSALIGASRPQQIKDNVAAALAAPLSADELKEIDAALK